MAVETLKKDTEVTPSKEAPVTPKPNLMSQISQPEAPAATQPEVDVIAQAKNDLDQIKDPVSRKIMEDKIKNLEKGVNAKFMAIAEERKSLEAEKAKLNQPWTPERLKAELSRQDFIQSANILNSEKPPEGSGVSQEQWSYLTPEEKAEIMRPINDLKREVDTLKNQNQSVMRDKIDTNMKAKWGDYDPAKVDQFFQSVNGGRLNDEQLIEMSWKALNFDRYIERAHKLGLEGRNSDLQEKINGSSFSGSGHSTPQEEPPKRNENETSHSFFKRLADWRRVQSGK